MGPVGPDDADVWDDHHQVGEQPAHNKQQPNVCLTNIMLEKDSVTRSHIPFFSSSIQLHFEYLYLLISEKCNQNLLFKNIWDLKNM